MRPFSLAAQVVVAVAVLAASVAGADLLLNAGPYVLAAGMLYKPGVRLIDTVAFTAGARVPVDIQVPQTFMRRLLLRVFGSLNIAAGTTDGVPHVDGAANLIRSLELLVDGKTLKQGSGASFFRLAQLYHQTVGRNTGITSGAVATYPFEALIPILFESPSSVAPTDTFLDGRDLTSIDLNLTWGDAQPDLIIGGDRDETFSVPPQCEIYVVETEPFVTRGGFWGLREVETTLGGVLTSTGTRLQVPFTPGAVMRAIQLRGVDGSNLSDTVINRITARLNGGDQPLRDLAGALVQDEAQHLFGIDTRPVGYYHLELAEAGRVLSTGLGAQRKLNAIDLILDTTVGAGATSIVAHTVEYVPPGGLS